MDVCQYFSVVEAGYRSGRLSLPWEGDQDTGWAKKAKTNKGSPVHIYRKEPLVKCSMCGAWFCREDIRAHISSCKTVAIIIEPEPVEQVKTETPSPGLYLPWADDKKGEPVAPLLKDKPEPEAFEPDFETAMFLKNLKAARKKKADKQQREDLVKNASKYCWGYDAAKKKWGMVPIPCLHDD